MMINILIAGLVAGTGVEKGKGPVPLAAVIVRSEALVFLDMDSRSERRLVLPGLIPVDADLSPDKKLIAVTARNEAKPADPVRLYFANPANGTPTLVETGIAGHHRFPRFGDAGKLLVFSATAEPIAEGPANPMRVHALDVATRKTRGVKTTPDRCEFRPAPLERGTVAHVSTTCLMGADLYVTEKGGRDKFVKSVAGLDTEVASSPDGKKLLFTSRTLEGLGFFIVEGQKAPRLLATVPDEESRLQPSFVCPKDVLFERQNKIFVLNTEDGKITDFAKIEGGPDAAHP